MIAEIVAFIWSLLLSLVANLSALLPTIIATTLVLGGLWLALRRIDPDRAERLLSRLLNVRPRLTSLLLTLVIAAVAGAGLVEVTKGLRAREDVRRSAAATRERDPNLSPVVQYAPSLAVIEEKTYTRTLTLPPDFAARIGSEGAGVFAPYLSDPSAEGVTKLVDAFRRSGGNVIFTRQLTRRDESPVAIDSARVRADFRGARRVYAHRFEAEYRFGNGTEQPAEMRLTFPLPQHTGTLEGFSLTVDGKPVSGPDPDTGGYVWTGIVPPGGRPVAKASYSVSGGREYVYALGSDRRRIRDFVFEATSDRPPRFSRSGIYPTSQSGNAATWNLKDVITSQSISLAFSAADPWAEALTNSLALLPLVLGLFAIGAWSLAPDRAVRAVLAFAFGLAGTIVLSGYLPPTIAVLIGAAVAAVLGGVVLRSRRGWGLALVGAAIVVAPLSVVHTSLTVWLVGLIVLGALVLGRRPRTA